MGTKGKRKLSAWQVHVKNVMAKNPNLSFKQALRKAKQSYHASSGTKRSSKSRRRSNPRRVTKKVRNLARRKRKGGGKSIQRTAFKWLRIGALLAPAGVVAAQPLAPDQKVNEAFRLYTGVNIKHSMESGELKFDVQRLAMGWTPFLAAVLTTYGIPKLAGIIRKL